MVKKISKLVALSAICLSAMGSDSGIPLQLARGGKAAAEIVLPGNADVTLRFAADELQYWIEQISGAKLPVVNAENDAANQIVLDPASSRYPDDAKKLAGNDGFSVRSKNGKVYINASAPKGILNGVFRLLYKNSDIIWARPDTKKGTFFTVVPDFTLTRTNFIDIPKFLLRGWQMGHVDPGGINNLWQVRNGSNWDFLQPDDPDKRKYSSIMEFGGGHNLIHIYIPENKYFKTHPEFYPLINGKRVQPSTLRRLSQLCFTNEELFTTFLKEVEDRVIANPNFDTYRILAEDNYVLCECSECVKPITLPDGSVVKHGDPAFYSTQFFIFLNRIAVHFQKNYPGKRILTYAYFFTLIPPRCKVEENIDVVFCPIRKNSKYPIDDPVCEAEKKAYLGWNKITRNITWRDYYGLCWDFPRPIDEIAFKDWRYVWNKGSRRTYTEMRRDEAYESLTPIWNCNSLYFWMLAQGCWDPFQDINTLRNEFFSRVYGAAAEDVAEYYRLIEKQWKKHHGDSRWNDPAFDYWQKYVVETGIIPACRAALERAAKRDVSVVRKGLIADLRENFEKSIALAKARDITVPRTKSKVPFDPSFKKKPWGDSRVIDESFPGKSFRKVFKDTKVRLIGDKKNLYIGLECLEKAGWQKSFIKPGKNKPQEIYPYGECFDMIIHGKWRSKVNYIRLFIDPAGNCYSRGRMIAVKSRVKRSEKSWSALITIPWSELKINPDRNKSFKAQFVRHRISKAEQSLMFTPADYRVMLGGEYDRKSYFCEIKIGK